MTDSFDPVEVIPDESGASAGVFAYGFHAEVAKPIVAVARVAYIDCMFRHFHSSAIEIGAGGSSGQLNLGFRLTKIGSDQVVFEDRALFGRTEIPAGQWVTCQIRIPVEVIEFQSEHKLIVDVVRENEYWFSDRVGDPQTLNVHFADSSRISKDTLQALQVPMLEDSLSRAYARIAELEYSERNLIAERDEYKGESERLLTRLKRTIDDAGLALPPSATIAEMLTAFTPVERRDRWLSVLSKIGVQGTLFTLYPHAGGPGTLQILVHGSGGYGDMIYLGVVVRELREHFGSCDVFVMHENRNVSAVFGLNPYVTGSFSMAPPERARFLQLVHSIDVFDLLVEVRYAVTYSFPPLSRIPAGFQQRALYAGAEWQKYVRYDWPHTNHAFANAVMARGLHKLDVVGSSSLLAINRESDVDIFVPLTSMRMVPSLVGKRFITIHHGADRNMAAAPGLQTKNLSTATWVSIVMLMRAAGFSIVQLGEHHEIFVTGVDVDLRGQTTLAETAFIIKCASVHVDTEGGLVHVARAVNTRAVVAFGPTPVGFFGYPQNINIPPQLCGNCWWITKRWAAECPRSLVRPECMESHDASNVAEKALAIAQTEYTVQVDYFPNFRQSIEKDLARDTLAQLPPLVGTGLLLVGLNEDLHELIESVLEANLDCILLVHSQDFPKLRDEYGSAVRIRPYSDGNISLATASYPWAIAFGMDVRNENGMHLALDLRRCVARREPCFVLAQNRSQPLPIQDWLEHISIAGIRQLGGRYRIEAKATNEPALTNFLLLSLTHKTDEHQSPA